MLPGLGRLLLHLVPAVGFRMLRSLACDILGLHFDLRIVLNVLLLNLHMMVVELLHLPLHMLVEGWPHTLLVAVMRVLREVAHTLGWMVRTQLAVVLVVSVLKLVMLLAWLVLVAVGLGVW